MVEEKLWADKIIRILEQNFKRTLKNNEKQKIYDSVREANKRRYKIIKKYIEHLIQKPINLTSIIDLDIYEDINIQKKKFMKETGIKNNEFAEMLIKRSQDKDQKEFGLKHMEQYIDQYLAVMFLYTGEFLSLLQRKQHIKTPKAIIMEPWSHAGTTYIEKEFNFKVFGKNNGKNNHLVEGGKAENLAFIAMDEVGQYEMKNSKKHTTISMMPNILNYKDFIEKLNDDSTISSLDLTINRSFLEGFNYLPYGKCREALLNMIRIRDDYRNKRAAYKKQNPRNDINNLRKTNSQLMKEQAEFVNLELFKLFKAIFN
ncbi:hypothetical protein ACFLRM_03375 [Acidobacteriota bacterium]